MKALLPLLLFSLSIIPIQSFALDGDDSGREEVSSTCDDTDDLCHIKNDYATIVKEAEDETRAVTKVIFVMPYGETAYLGYVNGRFVLMFENDNER